MDERWVCNLMRRARSPHLCAVRPARTLAQAAPLDDAPASQLNKLTPNPIRERYLRTRTPPTIAESIRLSKLLKQPYDLYHPGVMDTYILGLADQRSGRMDPTLTTEIANHLFEKPGKFFGLDLAAINIQRGRDMGVPGYNHFREYCGLPRAKYFEDLSGVFSNKTLLRMSQLYKHVDDIDLFTAGISEYPIADGLVGPTFACLIARQFVNLRRGDRFWYENAGYPAQFTIDQLDELRKSTSARLMCDNSDDLDTIQASAMLIADPYTNPRVPCHSLPAIDLSKWKEQQAGYEPAQSAPPAYAPPDHAPPMMAALDYEAGPASHPAEYQAAQKEPMELVSHEQPAPAALQQHQQQYQSHQGAAEYEPLKMQSHFVDHLVDLNNYRPETAAYRAAASS